MMSISYSSKARAIEEESDTIAEEIPSKEIYEPEGFVLYSEDENGEQLVFEPEEDYQCFNAEEWSDIGHLITDYHWLYWYAGQNKLIISNYKMQITNLKLQIDLWKNTINRVDKTMSFTQNLLNEDRKIKFKTNLSNKITMWAAVGVALIEAGIIGVVVASR